MAYLSPDAPSLLQLPHPFSAPSGADNTSPIPGQPVLILAAIIDRTVQQGASLHRAHSLGIPAARLPFGARGVLPGAFPCHQQPGQQSHTPLTAPRGSVVLNLEHVARCCLHAAAAGGGSAAWHSAWGMHVPRRITAKGRLHEAA